MTADQSTPHLSLPDEDPHAEVPLVREGERLQQEASSAPARSEGLVSTQYSIRVPDVDGDESGTEVLDPSVDLADAVARLDRYRDTWPTASLVRRTVVYGAWEDVWDTGDHV